MSARQLTIGRLNAAKQATIKKGTGKVAFIKHYIEKVKLFSLHSPNRQLVNLHSSKEMIRSACRNDASSKWIPAEIGFFLHCLAQDVFHILL